MEDFGTAAPQGQPHDRTQPTQDAAATFAISFFNNKSDNAPKQCCLTVDELSAVLTQQVRRRNKDGRLFSPTLYLEDEQRKDELEKRREKGNHSTAAGRANENVEALSCFVLDFDDGADALEITRPLDEAGWCYILHTTHSHTREHPKFRVTLPLSEPVKAAQWPDFWKRAAAHLGQGHADQTAKDAARIYYTPSCPPEGTADAFEFFQPGERLLSPGEVPDEVAEEGAAPQEPRPTGARAAGRTSSGGLRPYVAAALKNELQAVENAPEGERNHTLNKAAHALGQLVGAGELDEARAVAELVSAATNAGLPEVEARRTIASGLKSGKQKPRQVPEPRPSSYARNQQEPATSEEGQGTGTANDRGSTHGQRSTSAENAGKRTQADVVLEMAQREAEVFRNSSDDFFATVGRGDGRLTYPLNSQAFRSWLSAQHFRETGRAASSSAAIQTTLDTLRGIALDTEPREVSTRVAATRDAIYYDLGDATGRAVEIKPEGWHIVAASPVAFVRPRGMLPQVEPQRGGKVESLRQVLNIAGDDDFALVTAWMLSFFQPTGARPHLGFIGEQGTAKTGTTTFLRTVLDPNKAPTRKEPKEPRDFMIGAKNNALVAYDNLSRLPAWLSDCLCCLATGAGFATRANYTDDEEIIFSLRRPAIFNAIHEVATRPDLLDRVLLLELPILTEEKRKQESELDASFERVRPLVLGAIFDAVAIGLQNLPTTRPKKVPRMADFATWIEACAPGLGWESGHFLKLYGDNRETVIDTAAELSTLTHFIEGWISQRSLFEGTPAELFDALSKAAPHETKCARDWPADARALGRELQRIAPVLRARSVEITQRRSHGARSWMLKSGSKAA